MNPQETLRLVDSISRDRNVDKETLYRDLEQALVSAARKHFNAVDTEEFTSEIDRMTGKIHVWRGEEEIPLELLSRIAAQTAKQVMIQRFREDERASVYNEFSERVGELVTGVAQRYEGGALVITVGRSEGFMPRSEQIPGEQHQPGERVRCLIREVRDTGSQVKIVLSRAHSDFIRRLFEVEVPEVSERIIEVKAMAREAGHRTKIAVSSIDSKVDAVGACVGVRGSRIKNIVDELGGEKIDIVRWNESSQILIQNALKPAEVVEISLCFELGRAVVVVNEDQLSLAIGKRGQNVRLAAKLTNWDVDILTPTEFTKSLDIMEQTLKQIEGLDEEKIDRLAALGVISVMDVEEVGADYLAETLEVGPEQAERAVLLAADRARQVAEDQAREKQEAERAKAAEPGEQQAAAILGGGGGEAAPKQPAGEEGEESGDILDLIEKRRAEGQATEARPDEGEMRDEALADDAVEEGLAQTEDSPSGSDPSEIAQTQSEQKGSSVEAIADDPASSDKDLGSSGIGTPSEAGTPDVSPSEEVDEQPAIEPEQDEPERG